MKKIMSLFFSLLSTLLLYSMNNKHYTIADGPFKNETIKIKEILSITTDSVTKKEIYNILLRRIANLEPTEKQNYIKALLPKAHQKNLLQELPEKIKKDQVCLCSVGYEEEEHYIDMSFLKEKD